MRTTRDGSRGAPASAAAAFVLLAACLLGPAAARGQWTAPDAGNNISNTNTGNVGIATTAPAFRFEVRGTTSRTIAGFTGDGDSVGYAGFRIGAFTTTGIASNRTSAFNFHMRKDNWYGGDGSGPSFIIETVSTTGGFAAPFLITPTNDVILNGGKGASGLSYGNVGVGTTAPTGKFDLTVSGAPNGGGIDFVVRDGVAANSNPIAFSHKVGTTNGALSRIGFNMYSNDVNYAVINPASGGWAIQSDNRNGITAPSLQFSSFTTAPVKTDVLTLLQGGNVGIGTTSPTMRLQVAGQADNLFQVVSTGSAATDTVANFSSAVGNIMQVRGNGNVGIGTGSPAYRLDVAGSVNSSGLCLGGDCKTAWSQLGSQWTTSGTSVYYGAGNVGVGTAAPIRGFQISGPNGSGSSEFVLENTGMPANSRKLNLWGSSAVGASGRFFLRLLNDAGSATTRDFMSFDNATGNVGVGTTSPTQLLDVSGAADIKARVGGGTSAAVLLQETTGAATWSEWQQYNDRLRLNTHDGTNLRADLVTVMPTGLVGIGTASPGSLLEVRRDQATATEARVTNVADGGFAGLYLNGGFGQAAGGFVQWNNVVGSNNLFVATGGNVPLHLGTNNAVRLSVMPTTGNVGIGTSSPGQKLDVAGNVNAAGLCLAGDCKTAWSQVGGTSQWANGANSSINYTAGNVGIGAAAPSAKLHIISADDTVAPALSVRQDTNPLYGFDLTLDTNVNGNLSFNRVNNGASASVLTFDRAGGNVGVGTSAPAHALEVAKPVAGNFAGLHLYNAAAAPYNSADSVSLSLGRSPTHVMGQITASNKATGTFGDGYLAFSLRRADVVTERMRIDEEGRVGIGKTNPTAALDVVGDIKATGSVSATYQDVAEWVPSAQKLSAGTVVVLDTGRTNHVVASSAPYDTKVAGVVSETPGVILGVAGDDKVKVATTGRVRVRVDASRGSILVGDLLVTSEVEGVAMKSVPVELGGTRIHRPGTIIGKALEPLEKGTGDILVLLSLQ